MNDPGNSKVTLGSKNQKKFHGGCMPPDLEAYAFDVCLGKRSVFILDPRPQVDVQLSCFSVFFFTCIRRSYRDIFVIRE